MHSTSSSGSGIVGRLKSFVSFQEENSVVDEYLSRFSTNSDLTGKGAVDGNNETSDRDFVEESEPWNDFEEGDVELYDSKSSFLSRGESQLLSLEERRGYLFKLE
eukprot:TRINITY_DN450_c0_g1_i1.p3 TRINITY_DN450_c0_g1~~TRINITY_DN450_c0_g1_i1.p3  ORF type:complete len:105 (-),score=18.35 TRINITY_DN450_c0_g1_i1:691-1005(-)